jgi:TRAP-type C4-dicarboxylate transport system permease large subunit
VLIPIYDPILPQLGFDAIWFWTLFMINLVLGSISPPFGYVLFALKAAVPVIPMFEIYRAAWGAVLVTVIGLAVMTIFPGIVTVLPDIFK